MNKLHFFCIITLLSFFSVGYAQSDSLDLASKGSFTIAVMSDTQLYKEIESTAESNNAGKMANEILNSQTQWIIDNMENQNIIFVSHAGDVVDVNSESQWNVAKKLLNRLLGKLPYGISLGNHDMTSTGDTYLFQKYFPASMFESFNWYGGNFENNTNSYQLLSSNGIDIIIIHIECNAPDRVLDWANCVLEKYPDRLAIITTHMFLGPRETPVKDTDYYDEPKGVMKWHKTFGSEGNSPYQLWNKCFKKHKNIKMIFCGDQSRTNALYQKYLGENGNLVHIFLSDYNLNPGGGLRLYRFLPLENRVKVITYNTIEKAIVKSTSVVSSFKEHCMTITDFF